MVECSHLRPDKTEFTNDSEQSGFVAKRPRWLKEKANNFVQNLDKGKLQDTENGSDADPQFITQLTIDNIVDNLTSVLLDSAERTNSTPTEI